MAKTGQDLGAEDLGFRPLAGPFPDRGLVSRILGPAELCRPSAVGWVSLLNAELGKHRCGALTTMLALVLKPTSAARFAVPTPAVAQLSATVPASAG